MAMKFGDAVGVQALACDRAPYDESELRTKQLSTLKPVHQLQRRHSLLEQTREVDRCTAAPSSSNPGRQQPAPSSPDRASQKHATAPAAPQLCLQQLAKSHSDGLSFWSCSCDFHAGRISPSWILVCHCWLVQQCRGCDNTAGQASSGTRATDVDGKLRLSRI